MSNISCQLETSLTKDLFFFYQYFLAVTLALPLWISVFRAFKEILTLIPNFTNNHSTKTLPSASAAEIFPELQPDGQHLQLECLNSTYTEDCLLTLY